MSRLASGKSIFRKSTYAQQTNCGLDVRNPFTDFEYVDGKPLSD